MQTPETIHAPRMQRVDSIDVLRGLVMILMALDHVRDFFGVGNPSDLMHGSVPLFFTRWITDFCAPVFFQLTGTSAYLAGKRRTQSQLSLFLVSRGLWLILLELTILRCLGWQFNVDYRVTLLSVISALGWAMIILAGLVWLPVGVSTTFGVLLIALHNLTDGARFANPLWTVLHSPGFLFRSSQHVIFVAYPLVPWIGVCAVGLGLGRLYERTQSRRRKFLLWIGTAASALFIIMRLANGYGDPRPWMMQRSFLLTICSFLDTTKYPPSLDFLLMTLGPAALVLVLLEYQPPRLFATVRVFGKVPLFYYVLHVVLIHLVAVLFCYLRYGHVYWMFRSANVSDYPVSRPPGWGVPLWGTYAIWITVVVTLYPLCRWFAALKQRRSDAWLSYL